MDRSGVSYALAYGANRSGSAVSWLTGWPVTREALLVVGPAPDDDLLFVSYFNHVPQARRVSVVPAAWTGASAVATALDAIASRRRVPDRIGLVGALPFDQYRLLTEQVPVVADMNPAYTRLRLVKSAEELAALQRGAELTDVAIGALADALRPGATDHEVLAGTEHAYVSRGGLHQIHYLGITSMDDPVVSVPAQWPTGCVIRHGDVITCEISVAAAPTTGQVLRTFTVEAPAASLFTELHSVAVAAAFDAVAARLTPGTRAWDLAEPRPLSSRRPASPPLSAPDFVLSEGMTLVVQPNAVTGDRRGGVQTGELLLVTEHGPQRLYACPQGLQQAGRIAAPGGHARPGPSPAGC